MVGIYKITSPTGRVYIGQSFDINKRKNNYRFLGCKSQGKLYRSLVKYSWNSHRFEVVHQLPDDIDVQTITDYEQLYMDLYADCGVDLMNLKQAGNAGKFTNDAKKRLIGRPSPTKGKPQSEETKKRRSDAMKGKSKSQETRERMSGAVKTDSWRANLSIAQIKRFKISPNPLKINRDSLLPLVDDYKNTTLSIKKLGTKYGVSKNTVWRVVKEMGVQNRSVIKNNKLQKK
jgi:group I intron endonuclease